jgi:hypothetical protein
MHDRFAAALHALHAKLGLTGIASANVLALGPLARACDVWYPQCYATTKRGSADPHRVVRYGLQHWRNKFGWRAEEVVGLAAYSQPSKPESYMDPCIEQALGCGVASVYYWSLGAIAKRADVIALLANLERATSAPGTGREQPADPDGVQFGGIHPRLDLAVLPGGIPVKGVELLQRLLPAWGCDPGEPDGKAGPKTIGALKRFKSARGLPATPVLDGATWWQLLRA